MKNYFDGVWEEVETQIIDNGLWRPSKEPGGWEERWEFGDGSAVKIYCRGILRNDARYDYRSGSGWLEVEWDFLFNIAECYRVEWIDDDEVWLYDMGDSRWPELEEYARMKLRRV